MFGKTSPPSMKGMIHSLDQSGMNGAKMTSAPTTTPATAQPKRSRPWNGSGAR